VAPPRESRLNAADGIPLFVADWPGHNPQAHKAWIVLMHGLGEHSGRYAHVARFFNDCGWSVRLYDHRGHGRSGGPRGDVPDGKAMLRDAKLVVDDLAQHAGAPPLLCGHSMGGLFAARFAVAALSPLRGLILSSPALSLRLSGVQKLLLKSLFALAPGYGVPNGLRTRYLSHDPAVEQAYLRDPLVHSRISARLLQSMLDAIAFSQSHAASLAVPTLMMVAGDDRLVDASGSDAFFARLAPGVGTMHRYENFYHELFNETQAQRVFGDLHAWLNSRILEQPLAASTAP
jgi:alpha-beta hydrolase superfamily lysophospholipase